MKDQAKKEIAMHIQSYAQFMSFEAAVAKVKRNNLGRIDVWVDEVAKLIKAS